MAKKNVIDWKLVEGLASEYVNTGDEFKREDILASILSNVENYLLTGIRNATTHAIDAGLSIPAEDFESHMLQAVWNSVESFEEGSKYAFKSILARRIQTAEANVFRLYRRRSDDKNDKDGYTYESARWDSINRQVGGGEGTKELGEFLVSEAATTEEVVIENETINNILAEFKTLSKMHQRHENIIRHMYAGYTSDDLAIATGLAESNNGTMRKHVSRAKKAFEEFMNGRIGE